MTFDELVKANSSIATIDMKGKYYAEVNQRIKAFRMLYPNGSIQTEIVSHKDGVVIFKATVFNEEGKIIGTGTAYEKEGSSFINKTSYIENCETSAVGRALGMCGIGIDTSVASYEEVANAVANQEQQKFDKHAKEKIDPLKAVVLQKRLEAANVNLTTLLARFGVGRCEDLTEEAHMQIHLMLEKEGK